MAARTAQRYGVLDQAQEDTLHATRLLGVEEKPFSRVTKRLLFEESLINTLATQLPSPPPENEDAPPPSSDEDAFKRQKYREDILLDFANLENSVVRIQLILSSNQRERERYAAEKAKIMETAQAVKENTAELRVQLEEAQRVRERRKGYDELASKILDNKDLKSRDECQAEIERLEKEIEDLQQEGAEYEGTWVGRREQFDKVVMEGEAMVRLIKGIRDEPEVEAEKDEDMEDGDDGAKGESSIGTPMPAGRTPMHESGHRSVSESGDAGGATPARPMNRLLDIEYAVRTPSRPASPAIHRTEGQVDVEMAEADMEAGAEAIVDQMRAPGEGVADTMEEA